MEYIKHLWNGNRSLPFTYWVIFIIGNSVLSGVDLLFDIWGLYDSLTLIWVVIAISSAYYVFSIVSVWRSSNKYEGAKAWAVLAKVGVILGILRTIVDVSGSF